MNVHPKYAKNMAELASGLARGYGLFREKFQKKLASLQRRLVKTKQSAEPQAWYNDYSVTVKVYEILGQIKEVKAILKAVNKFEKEFQG